MLMRKPQSATICLLLATLSLLSIIIFTTDSSGQSICNPSYPIPDDDGVVFYLQRSGNSNTVVYSVNQLPDGSINPSNPVNAFWRYLSGSGRKADLRALERRLAFGVKMTPLAGQQGKYTANLNAAPDIKVRVEPTNDGKVRAVMPIKGEEARLVCIYVEWRQQLGIIPKVLHIDFHGFTLDGSKHVVERLIPSKKQLKSSSSL